jgi:micrococcal nuclease
MLFYIFFLYILKLSFMLNFDTIDWTLVHDSNTPLFSLKGLTFIGKCVKVYDGDSIKVVIPFHNSLSKFTIRLSHIDSPEMRSKNEKEYAYAHVVRDKLAEKILDKLVTIQFHGADKYGRELSTVLLEGENINDWMIANDYAVAYEGGSKQDWCDILANKTT